MNWKRVILIIIPIALIAMVAIRLKSNKNIAEERVYYYNKEKPVGVKADTIKLKPIENYLSYSGTFEPFKETKISSEIQGKINTLLVDLGSEVKKGQKLIQLDNSLLKLQLEGIEIQIEGLEADVKRYMILANADAIQGVQLEKVQLELKSAKVQKATLWEQINKSSIRAPFDGIVTAKLTEEGAFAAPGVPLLQITDIRKLKFTVNVPEKELNQFRINQNYIVNADIYPSENLSGKALMISSKANIGNTFAIQFLVNNAPNLKVKSGMFGKVLLDGKSSEKGFIIPASAVQSTEQHPQVYLIKNNQAFLQDITILSRMQNKVIVSDGIMDGDLIITKGFINLFDGAYVSLK
jgi:membrane fusion protein, multidrug efflux system